MEALRQTGLDEPIDLTGAVNAFLDAWRVRALWSVRPEPVAGVVERVRAKAEALSGTAQPLRPLLKRAKLMRLGKALGA